MLLAINPIVFVINIYINYFKMPSWHLQLTISQSVATLVSITKGNKRLSRAWTLKLSSPQSTGQISFLIGLLQTDRKTKNACAKQKPQTLTEKKKNKIDYLKGAWLEFHPLPFSYPSTQSPQSGEKISYCKWTPQAIRNDRAWIMVS